MLLGQDLRSTKRSFNDSEPWSRFFMAAPQAPTGRPARPACDEDPCSPVLCRYYVRKGAVLHVHRH